MPKISHEQEALLDFVDVNVTSIVQAFNMAAESNNQSAADIEALPAEQQDAPGFPGPLRSVAVLMRQSAQSWTGMALRLNTLHDALEA